MATSSFLLRFCFVAFSILHLESFLLSGVGAQNSSSSSASLNGATSPAPPQQQPPLFNTTGEYPHHHHHRHNFREGPAQLGHGHGQHHADADGRRGSERGLGQPTGAPPLLGQQPGNRLGEGQGGQGVGGGKGPFGEPFKPQPVIVGGLGQQRTGGPLLLPQPPFGQLGGAGPQERRSAAVPEVEGVSGGGAGFGGRAGRVKRHHHNTHHDEDKENRRHQQHAHQEQQQNGSTSGTLMPPLAGGFGQGSSFGLGAGSA